MKTSIKYIILAGTLSLISVPSMAANVSGSVDTDVKANKIKQKNKAALGTNKMELGGASGNSNVSGQVSTKIDVEKKIQQKNKGAAGINEMDIGAIKNSRVSGSVTTTVNAKKIKQTNKFAAGRNSMSIGSVKNSTASATVKTTVNVKKGIEQKNEFSAGNNDMRIGTVSN